jgi:hypothetical protein
MYLLYGALSLYLTYYTASYARSVWKNGDKAAAVIVGFLAACFPFLMIRLLVSHFP